MKRRRGLAALAVAALTLAGCSSSGDAPQAPGEVVHVRLRLAGAPGFEDQWVELRTGRYRLQSPDGRQWWVFDGRRRFEDRISGATTLRIGSRRYLDGALSSAQADERGLFAIRPALATSIDREVPAGARSTLGIGAYWYGPRWRRLTALTAAEIDRRERPPEQAHIVFYDPADAGNRSSGYANSPAPRGEVQVVSLNRRSHLARRKIQTTRGHPGGPPEPPWPSRRLTLADGERVVVIPFRYRTVDGFRQPGFYVLTARTLVSVNTGLGMRSALRLAADLRPAG